VRGSREGRGEQTWKGAALVWLGSPCLHPPPFWRLNAVIIHTRWGREAHAAVTVQSPCPCTFPPPPPAPGPTHPHTPRLSAATHYLLMQAPDDL
jgi:hypothetical protein